MASSSPSASSSWVVPLLNVPAKILPTNPDPPQPTLKATTQPSRAQGTKRRKVGGSRTTRTFSRGSIQELDPAAGGQRAPHPPQGWLVPLANFGPGQAHAGRDEASRPEANQAEEKALVAERAHLDKANLEKDGAVEVPTGEPRARGCAATARSVALDPVARKLAQDKVRAKFYAKNVETVKSCKLALAEDLAHLGGVKVLYPLSEETLLIVAGALDSAGYRSASSYFSELRLRHIELDFAISPALERTFKKVNDDERHGTRQEGAGGQALSHRPQRGDSSGWSGGCVRHRSALAPPLGRGGGHVAERRCAHIS